MNSSESSRVFFLVSREGERYDSEEATRVTLVWDAEMASQPLEKLIQEELDEDPGDVLLQFQMPSLVKELEGWQEKGYTAGDVVPSETDEVKLVARVDEFSRARRTLLASTQAGEQWWPSQEEDKTSCHPLVRNDTTAWSVEIALVAPPHEMVFLPGRPEEDARFFHLTLRPGEPVVFPAFSIPESARLSCEENLQWRHERLLESLREAEEVSERLQRLASFLEEVVAVVGVRREVRDGAFTGPIQQAALLYLGPRDALFQLHLTSLRSLQWETGWYQCLLAPQRSPFEELETALAKYHQIKERQGVLLEERFKLMGLGDPSTEEESKTSLRAFMEGMDQITEEVRELEEGNASNPRSRAVLQQREKRRRMRQERKKK